MDILYIGNNILNILEDRKFIVYFIITLKYDII